jgi:hypothetical protein
VCGYAGVRVKQSARFVPPLAGKGRFRLLVGRRHQVPVVEFARGQRQDDQAKEHLARSSGEEGILFIGEAQEKGQAIEACCGVARLAAAAGNLALLRRL